VESHVADETQTDVKMASIRVTCHDEEPRGTACRISLKKSAFQRSTNSMKSVQVNIITDFLCILVWVFRLICKKPRIISNALLIWATPRHTIVMVFLCAIAMGFQLI
jgi:hypothetical protein